MLDGDICDHETRVVGGQVVVDCGRQNVITRIEEERNNEACKTEGGELEDRACLRKMSG